MSSGIYIITNNANNKHYIGYSSDTERRLRHHKSQLQGGYHNNKHLQRSFDKYGEEAFSFEHLESWPIEVLPSMENYWCKMLNTHDRSYGFNIKPTDGITGGIRMAEETRDKISVALAGPSNPRYGKEVSDITRTKMSVARIGKTGALCPKSKKVIDIVTGVEYISATIASESIGIKYSTLRNMLQGRVTNKTTLRYAS